MELEVAIGCVVLVVVAYIAGRVGYAIENDKRKESEHGKMNDAVDAAIKVEDNRARNLLIRALGDIGCQYETDEDGTIIFKYQGEVFQINASNDSRFIWIYDVACWQMRLDDPDAELLKQAINKANEQAAVTSLYTIYKEQKVIAVHCRMVYYFYGNIESPHDYLKSILDSFFDTHQCVKDEFDKLKRIKGFCSN